MFTLRYFWLKSEDHLGDVSIQIIHVHVFHFGCFLRVLLVFHRTFINLFISKAMSDFQSWRCTYDKLPCLFCVLVVDERRFVETCSINRASLEFLMLAKRLLASDYTIRLLVHCAFSLTNSRLSRNFDRFWWQCPWWTAVILIRCAYERAAI